MMIEEILCRKGAQLSLELYPQWCFTGKCLGSINRVLDSAVISSFILLSMILLRKYLDSIFLFFACC